MRRLKWIEGAKAVYHPQWLRRWRADPFSVMPLYLEISPVGMCNHRCAFCAPEMLGYPQRSLPLDTMKRFLNELRELREEDPDKLGVKSIQYAGEGEPTLHKEYAEIVRLTREAGIDVGMLTNGTGFHAKLAERVVPLVNGYIQFSVNAGRRETYAKIHRTRPEHWDLVWKNIRNVAAIRRQNRPVGCDIGVNMTALIQGSREADGREIPPNWPEVEELVARAKESGADYVSVKPYSQHLYSAATAKHYGAMSYAAMMDELEETARRITETYSDEQFEVVFRISRFHEYEADSRQYSTCRATPTIWSYIQSDGLWLSCSAYWTDPRFALGNILKQSAREIWFGEARRKHLDFVLRHLDISKCRKTCHPDKENRLMARLAAMTDSEFDQTLKGFEKISLPERANFI